MFLRIVDVKRDFLFVASKRTPVIVVICFDGLPNCQIFVCTKDDQLLYTRAELRGERLHFGVCGVHKFRLRTSGNESC